MTDCGPVVWTVESLFGRHGTRSPRTRRQGVDTAGPHTPLEPHRCRLSRLSSREYADDLPGRATFPRTFMDHATRAHVQGDSYSKAVLLRADPGHEISHTNSVGTPHG